MSDAVGQTKQFGKGKRTVPHPAQKAQKWYPVDDESQPKKVSTALQKMAWAWFDRLDECDPWRCWR